MGLFGTTTSSSGGSLAGSLIPNPEVKPETLESTPSASTGTASGEKDLSEILNMFGIDEQKLEGSIFNEENFKEGSPMYHLMMLAKSLQ